MIETIKEKLKDIDEVYIIGHNNYDCDSCFSSFVLTNILNSMGYHAIFAILSDYQVSSLDKDIIDDYLKEKPVIIDNIDNKKFILVDHNDYNQSLKINNNNVILAIDHHIDANKVLCYSVEYTSTLLYIYSVFKDIYSFSDYEKELIALSVMTDSEYLTSSRFKESDKVLYDELNTNLDVLEIRKKYFKTTDFSKDILENILNNYKFYEIENHVFNRVIIKGYSQDNKYLDTYVEAINNRYVNSLLIWIDYDNLITKVYYNGNLFNTYNCVITSSVLIIKDIINSKRGLLNG